MSHGPSDFDSTRWTLIDQIRDETSPERREALDELLRRYLSPMAAHLVLRRNMQPQDAADLVQDFVANKILERDLVSRADRTRGRFRGFLLTALDRYFVDRLRYQNAQKRAAKETLSIDATQTDPAGAEQADVFDVSWGRAVLREAIQAMKARCAHDHADQSWEIFRLRVLEPMVSGTPPLDYEELVRRCGFASPRQASNALITARRRFQKCLRDVVAEYTRDEAEVEDEIDELREVMSTRGAITRDLLGLEEAATSDHAPPPDVEGTLGPDPAGLMALQDAGEPLWNEGELDQLWRHLLNAELPQVLSTDAPECSGRWRQRRMLDLFVADEVPLGLLMQSKDLGRDWARRNDSTIPADLGAAIYFSAIAAALVRHQQRITRLPDETLRDGFERLRDRTWTGAEIKDLLRQAIAQLAEPS